MTIDGYSYIIIQDGVTVNTHFEDYKKLDILFVDFVNSEERDYLSGEIQEHLLEDGWWDNFLSQHGLNVTIPLDDAVYKDLVEFRKPMRQLTENVVSDQEISPNDFLYLNEILANTTLHWQIIQQPERHLELVPEQKNLDWVKAKVITSFMDFLEQSDRQRLKICENNNCRWIFYDESKSRTRRYCSDTSCGNLLKVRRFRERQKEAHSKH